MFLAILKKNLFLFICLSLLFFSHETFSAPHEIQNTNLKPHRMILSFSPWKLTSNGDWRTLAQIKYVNAQGSVVVETYAKNGLVVNDSKDLTRLAEWANDDSSGIITLKHSHPIRITAWSLNPHYPTIIRYLSKPPDDLAHFKVVATNIGPYANAVGWTPLNQQLIVKHFQVWRISEGKRYVIATLPGNQYCYFDAQTISPDKKYAYQVEVSLDKGKTTSATSAIISSTSSLPETSIKNFYGKGMLIFFSPLPHTPNSYTDYPVDKVLRLAKSAGLDFIALQLQYGEFHRLHASSSLAWFNQLLTALHHQHIKVIAWVVPRTASFETEQNIIQLLNQ